MKYTVELSKNAQKSLVKIDTRYKDKIIAVLFALETNPTLCKRLVGDRNDEYSYRVGTYRIVYTIKRQELIILVIDVGHRREVYR
jgi:mRNA interferase RelE/StbE